MKESKIEKSLKKNLETDLSDYESQTEDAKKDKCIVRIAKEMNMQLAVDKAKSDAKQREHQTKIENAKLKAEAERLKLDKKRYEDEKNFNQRKWVFERSMRDEELDLNRQRLEIEKDRAQAEKEANEKRLIQEAKRDRRQLIVSIVGVAAPFVLGLTSKIIYAGLAFNAQKHDYKDYVMESKFSKEARDNLLSNK